ncbi:hypothetical protein [Herbaspirillum autotrophicum]|uniref:hypothetical protein n=1 Tax=Herbaspirillum autotrophicum TaxID=180195 RepID=UPI0012EE665C|nr:hypothetical protein [Herbaspirillum autotrophicum]
MKKPDHGFPRSNARRKFAALCPSLPFAPHSNMQTILISGGDLFDGASDQLAAAGKTGSALTID